MQVALVPHFDAKFEVGDRSFRAFG